VNTGAEVPAVEAAKAEPDAVIVPAISAIPVIEAVDEPAPMTFASAHGPEAEDVSQVETPAQLVSAVSEVPAPSAQSEPAAAIKTSADEVAQSVAESAEAKTFAVEAEVEPVSAPEPVVAPEVVVAPEPVAEVAYAPTPAVEAISPEPTEISVAPAPEAEAPVMIQDIELTSADTPTEPMKPADVIPELSVEPVAAVPAPEPPVPAHDEDVMAALQTLIPAPTPGAATVSAIAEDATSRIAASSNELTYVGASSARGRWIAEEVTLTAEESSISLEQEMERVYAAFAASEAARVLASAALETFPGTQPVVPAAVSEPPAISESESASAPEPASSEAIAPAVDATAVSAMATAAGAGETSSSPASAVSPASAESDSSSPAGSVAVPEPTMAVAAQAEPIEPAEAVIAQSDTQTSETELAGGIDDMGKNSEAFGFKMIRQSPAAGSKVAPKSEPVSKENFVPEPAEQEPAAMAAAAAAESASPAVTSNPAPAPTDPKAIASIVDSVLAELRPKIVEEIAKKLAGEGKKE
jgi:nicotinate-nucleotide--dimethylbenzimidazole phosphoribosyltransferase